MLSTLVTGERQQVRHLYQRSFQFSNAAKLTCTVNMLPRQTDPQNGLWERIILLRIRAALSPRDVAAQTKIWQDRSRIMRWVFDGLEQLIADDVAERCYRFQLDPVMKSDIDAYHDDVDQVGTWLRETNEFTRDPDGHIRKSDLFNLFVASTEIKCSRRRFYERVRAARFDKGYRGSRTNRARSFIGKGRLTVKAINRKLAEYQTFYILAVFMMALVYCP